MRMTSVLCLTLAVAACGEEPADPGPEDPPSSAPVATVTLNVVNDTFLVRSPVLLAATLRDSAGNTLDDREIAWSTSDSALATVSQTGGVLALALGVVTITASAEGKSASAVLTLVPKVTVSRRLPTTFAGDTTLLTATLTDANGAPMVVGAVAWSSSDEAVATVTPQGIVTGAAPGRATIRADASGASGSVELVVLGRPSLRANREITFLRLRFTPEEILIRELFRVDADGTNARLLSEPGRHVAAWEWSPSGDRIVVNYAPVDGHGSPGLYTMNPDGGDARELVPNLVPAPFARWAPDGGRLLFSRGSPPQLYSMKADGTDIVELTPPSVYSEQPEGEWSPDGRQIAFHYGFCWPLWLVDADGTNLRQVGGLPSTCNHAWSPDGKLIAFNTSPSEGGTGIWLMNSDGTDSRPFTSNCTPDGACGLLRRELRPRWSPDGTRVAYMSGTSGLGDMVHVANLDGAEVSSFQVGNSIQDVFVEWSPDGTRLLSIRATPLEEGFHRVTVSGLDGSVQVTIPSFASSDGPASWRR